MKEENFEQLVKMELEQLPTYVREALAGVDWLEALQEVTHKHHVHIDQVGKIRNETLLVLLGLIDSSEYIGKVSEILEDEGEGLDNFITDVNQDVFLPVREEILRRKESSKTATPNTNQSISKTSPAKSFVTQKLSQTDHKTQKQTDYSVKRKASADPYREALD